MDRQTLLLMSGGSTLWKKQHAQR